MDSNLYLILMSMNWLLIVTLMNPHLSQKGSFCNAIKHWESFAAFFLIAETFCACLRKVVGCGCMPVSDKNNTRTPEILPLFEWTRILILRISLTL